MTFDTQIIIMTVRYHHYYLRKIAQEHDPIWPFCVTTAIIIDKIVCLKQCKHVGYTDFISYYLPKQN